MNGTARLTDDAALCARFLRKEILPRTVIVIAISEVYSQCSRALQRSELWTVGDQSAGLPPAGDYLSDATQGRIDGQNHDTDREKRLATNSLW